MYRPTRLTTDAEAIAAAFGPGFCFSGAENDPYIWPFLPTEDGIAPANLGRDYTVSVLRTTVQAQAGDVMAFETTMNTYASLNVLSVYVNGEEVGTRSGLLADDVFAWEFAADGAYDIEIRYESEKETDWSEEVILRNFALYSGEEAQAALESVTKQVKTLPGSELRVSVMNADARRVEITANKVWYDFNSYCRNMDFYIVPEETALVKIELGKALDAYLVQLKNSNKDGKVYCAAMLETDATGYIYRAELCALDEEQYFTEIAVMRDAGFRASYYLPRGVVLFADEKKLDEYCRVYLPEKLGGATWSYADE